ncbi:hypothetical protein ESOMN_v1c04160 [Williamsoniiplasma somnilux]|uniref:Uncharacterized protein n=1 Tax=Williamsoniiplasma somnilux TaxID=215578 RepID=A0A2K8P013_9MOLU|nr:hypothetical protein [Williamsoniiplasma somnilux]ATZ18798.1 hypothetical protein ESOMN_v1c04160 [Williamsoniiplasma somnilux]
MYISVERNNRGSLDIEQYALNKLIQFTVNSSLNKEVKDVSVLTHLHHDNLIYVLIKITLLDGVRKIEIDEKSINKSVEEIIIKTLDLKPKNIAIAYSK